LNPVKNNNNKTSREVAEQITKTMILNRALKNSKIYADTIAKNRNIEIVDQRR
jgi:hypothetical protein